MSENIQYGFSHRQERNTLRNGEPGPAPTFPQIRRKLADGRVILFRGEPEMAAVFISKGVRVTLADSGTSLPDGRYQLEDGSELLVADGAVSHFERQYAGPGEMIIGALVGLILIFILFLLANGGL